MTDWYYADAERQRQGPLAAGGLTERFHQGRLRLDSLVWREGLEEWRPLREFARELALHEAPAETFYRPVDAAPPGVSISGVPASAAGGGSPVSPYAAPAAALLADETYAFGGDVVQAGFWKRVAAYILDAIVVTIAAQIVQMVLMVGFLGMNMGNFTSNPESMFTSASGIVFLLSIYLFPLVLFGVYYAAFHASARQATLGKMAVGIKVVRSDGHRISLARAVARFFAFILSGLILYIGYLMAAFTERKQALHDLICDTLVVDKWAYTAHPEWQRRELGTVTVVILCVGAVLLLGFLALMATLIGLAVSAAS